MSEPGHTAHRSENVARDGSVTYVVFPVMCCLIIEDSARYTLVIVLEKAKMIAMKCTNTNPTSVMTWNNAI